MFWLTYYSFYSQEIFICLPNSLVDTKMGVVKIITCTPRAIMSMGPLNLQRVLTPM